MTDESVDAFERGFHTLHASRQRETDNERKEVSRLPSCTDRDRLPRRPGGVEQVELTEPCKPVGVICHGPWRIVDADLVSPHLALIPPHALVKPNRRGEV
jgi:hypothetical protein